MKLIKFNLPLNGTSIGTLEQLQKNFTAEVLDHFRSGKLVKWLRVRNLTEQAGKVDQLIEEDNYREIKLFKNLNEVFGNEVDEAVAKELLDERKNILPSTQKNVDDEIEIITANFAKKEIQYEQDVVKIKAQVTAQTARALAEQKSVHTAEIKELIDTILKIHAKHAEYAMKSSDFIIKNCEKTKTTNKDLEDFLKYGLAGLRELKLIRNEILSKFNITLI